MSPQVCVGSHPRGALPPLRGPRFYCSSMLPPVQPFHNYAPRHFYKRSINLNLQQIGKKGSDVIRPEPASLPCMSSDPLQRISQLEQNIRFLQEQHQAMLFSLHQEIESLRSRNRDLQFQLIFGKSGVPVVHSSSDSSPDESGKPKVILSPKEVNTRSLHVEMLEREVAELKASLSEANTKHTNLTQLLEHQKKQLESAKKEKTENEYVVRLEEADILIKRLMKENEDQRKEMTSLRNQLSKNNGRYNGGHRGQRGNSGEHSNQQQHFPPLHSQSYWANTTHRHRTSPEYPGRRIQMDHEVLGQAAPTLPHLNRAFSQVSAHSRPRYYSNGNHFYRGNTVDEGENRRKYRGRGGGGGGNNRETSQ